MALFVSVHAERLSDAATPRADGARMFAGCRVAGIENRQQRGNDLIPVDDLGRIDRRLLAAAVDAKAPLELQRAQGHERQHFVGGATVTRIPRADRGADEKDEPGVFGSIGGLRFTVDPNVDRIAVADFDLLAESV